MGAGRLAAMERSAGIGALLRRMEGLLAPLEASGDPGRFFLATYMRTTRAVAEELERGGFRDPAWVERWDVAFADLYLDAVEDAQAGRRAVGGRLRRRRRRGLPPLRHVLLGMNAHINFDLAQSLLAVLRARVRRPGASGQPPRRPRAHRPGPGRPGRRRGHRAGGRRRRSRTDRLPLNRLTKRFLRESRAKVWANTRLLDAARRTGPDAYAARLAELERLAATRVADLMAPGQVVLKLAVKGFGVQLPAA